MCILAGWFACLLAWLDGIDMGMFALSCSLLLCNAVLFFSFHAGSKYIMALTKCLLVGRGGKRLINSLK